MWVPGWEDKTTEASGICMSCLLGEVATKMVSQQQRAEQGQLGTLRHRTKSHRNAHPLTALTTPLLQLTGPQTTSSHWSPVLWYQTHTPDLAVSLFAGLGLPAFIIVSEYFTIFIVSKVLNVPICEYPMPISTLPEGIFLFYIFI